jgi:hypothetical protein
MRFPMLVMAAVALLGAAVVVRAQQPTRLPAVVVNAPVERPGPRKIGGIVRDTMTSPLDSVEVAIVALQRRVFTKSDGTFLFADIAPGKYQVRARKIGYAPQIREMVVDSAGGAGAFALMPLAYLLRPVVTTVARGGLSGVVGDTSFNALPGADVQLLGHESRTVTDSTGSFYMPVRAGSYVVRVRDRGYADRLVSVIVPDDSGERIRVTLAPPNRPPTVREAHNVDDFGQRLAWRSTIHSRVYTHAELERMNVEWVQDAVQKGFREIHSGPPGTLDSDCVAIVNGGPDVTQVGALTVDDVETVEIYDMAAAPRPTRRRPIMPMPHSNTDRAAIGNSSKACAFVYVWLR